MADVFLSYKREDRERAREIAEGIAAHGYSVFYDADIDVGEAWNRRIEEEIAAARCVAVLWSPASTHVEAGEWVHNEARKGKERRILAPATIQDCTIPLEFSGVQAADLRDWRGDKGDPEWQMFVKRIGACLTRAPANLPPRKNRKSGRTPWLIPMSGLLVVAVGALAAWQMLRPQPVEPALPETPPATTPAAARVPGEAAASTLGPEWKSYVDNRDCERMRSWLGDVGKEYPDWELVSAGRGQLARMCGGSSVSPPPPAPSPSTRDPTRDDLLASLRADAPAPLTPEQVNASAARLGVEPAAIQALMHFQNGRGAGFSAEGRPVINFESQVFSRLTAKAYDASNPEVSSATFKAGNYSRPQAERWAQFTQAYGLDPEAALSATAWGRFRILGMNYKAAGFETLQAFVAAQAKSEDDQLRAFETFLKSRNLVAPLAALDWQAFSRGFFGTTQFAQQIERDYQTFKAGRTP